MVSDRLPDGVETAPVPPVPGASVNIHEAKSTLSALVARVERGEEIVISRAGRPVAKLVPLPRTTRRTGRGLLVGRLRLDNDWDSAQTNTELAADFGL
jgi:prevent-host-death family protein